MVWEKKVNVDQRSPATVMAPREVWRLTRPVVWLVPVAYATADLVVALAARLDNPDRPLLDILLVRGVAEALLVFVGLTLMGLVLVAVGWRRLWIVPVLLFQFGDVVRSLETVLRGAPWSVLGNDLLTVSGPLYRVGWLGGPLLILLVSAPALLLLRRRNFDIRHEPFGSSELAGVGTALLLVGMVTYLAIVLAPSETQLLPLIFTKLGPLVIFGAAVGTTKGWWPWAPVTVGVLMLGVNGWQSSMFLPLVSAPLIASLWCPIAIWFDTATHHSTGTLIALNVLNVADAVFTRLAVTAGVATELNPLVNGAGMTVKVLVVAAASVLIYRTRPRLLLWPTVALAAVTLWHLIGMVVNA
ncbi:MAG TPA: hypothetical protein ENH00_15090 [Actinobacteria bacterium]|nr:hypothetical protein BMS3Bbin01_01038 [bacterium BMS3Bbin01]HDH27488.1 hypothetical protein [Actinomycetota bacterium]